MSHWQKGKLSLTCDLSIMTTALTKISPKWEGHIQVDTRGNLSIYNSFTKQTRTGYHIVIPKSSKTGITYADIGLRQNANETWTFDADPDFIEGVDNLNGQILMEIAIMKQRELAQRKGFQMINEENNKNSKSITLRVPVAKQYKQILR